MDPTAINEHIERILRSQSFATKSQLRRLLGILSKNMDSQTALSPDFVIKELWPDETRTKRSADVATEMNRLRHALDAYYTREGHTDPIRIVLPNRSAAAVDGIPEKRWIVAMPHQRPQDDGAANYLRAPQVHPQGRLKRMTLIAAVGLAVAIVAYFSLRLFTPLGEPTFGRLDGSALVIMNAEGKALWKKVFPDGFSTDGYYENGLADRIWIGDLEGKGRSDILFLYLPATSPQAHSSILICYSDRGEEKWRWTPGRDLPEMEGVPATFYTYGLRVLKAIGERSRRIVVSSDHNLWWPNQTAILNSDGKLLSEYWHSGHLNHLVLADLDGNGKEEIVLTGISNGYHQATLIILDPDRVFGASTEAARPELQIHNMVVAQDRMRLLFPRSDLNKALLPFNQASEATIEHGHIRVVIWERLPLSCPIAYEFDKNFHLIAAFPGATFISNHVEFYRNGKDAHSFTSEEQAQFQKVRCLVGCKTEFVPTNVP